MAGSLSKRWGSDEDLLRDMKHRVPAARAEAALAVNRELVMLYWSISRNILERQDADDLRRHQDDQTKTGLVLCKHREDTVVEYAFSGTTQPRAVSQYELTKALPEDLKDKLRLQELEAEFAEPQMDEPDGSGHRRPRCSSHPRMALPSSRRARSRRPPRNARSSGVDAIRRGRSPADGVGT